MRFSRRRSFVRESWLIKGCLVLGVLGVLGNMFLMWRMNTTPAAPLHPVSLSPQTCPADSRGVVWIMARSELAMKHVITVFDRVEYRQRLPGQPWDILWSHQYPFTDHRHNLTHLLPHQRVNHFPGSSCFASKPQLASHKFPFVPKSFRIPDDAGSFREEAQARPDTLWLLKNNKHRGIWIVSPSKVDLSQPGHILQEFVTNPLLIDGRKFDIGVYTAVTSINPLRVYVYMEEILLRFCSEDYLPFDPRKTKTFVVDDEYTPSWEIPSLRPLVQEQQFSHKEALNAILQERGLDTDLMWRTITDIIQEVLFVCEPVMKDWSKTYTSTRYFFELVRFDFVVEESMRVWLMEVNFSPNLSSGHFLDNRFLYEQVVFNLLNLVGVARVTGPPFKYNGEWESKMFVSDKDIQVPARHCHNGTCQSCSQELPECWLCRSCRSEDASFALKTAFLEHVHKRNFRRIIPDLAAAGCHDPHHAPPKNLSLANQRMWLWFCGKCLQNPAWCH